MNKYPYAKRIYQIRATAVRGFYAVVPAARKIPYLKID
jgi:hypothetical protein